MGKIPESVRIAVETKGAAITQKIIDIRRDIHMNPEASKRESRTSQIAFDFLSGLGIPATRCTKNLGVVGLLKGGKPGKTVALRADMDALKLQEMTGLPFTSKVDGLMHACGHDAHTAMLLGVAEVLHPIREQIPGGVKFFFQPSEEAFPGGALGMIEDGCMENPHVDAAFALHVGMLPTGQIGLRAGGSIGGVTSVSIRVKGKGGHFSTPHKAVDPIVIAANIVVALQSLMTRQADPMEPIVLTFGTIQGGSRDNIIGEEVNIRGNLGAINNELRLEIAEKIDKVTKAIAESMGGSAEVRLWHGYPTVVNDQDMVKLAWKVGEEVFGSENVREIEPILGGEDFAFFLEKAPGALITLGIWDRVKYTEPISNHSPRFDLDERAIPKGINYLSQLALSYLYGA
ncbi:MAG: M20 family metallopeptidase [Syntrophales bacterium LBB04]|nr:M20 family metallopeptidase [Syntrophales bacterium LBB04]